MRGLNRLSPASGQPFAAAAAASSQQYSTFSFGAGGRGRGRGSGSPPESSPHVPGQPDPTVGEDDQFASSSLGHGRGQRLPPFPAFSGLPSFSSLMSPAGRGRARGAPPTPSADLQGSLPKQPIFFRRSDIDLPADKTQFADPAESGTLPRSIAPMLSGSGRGKPPRGGESDPRPSEENRHLQNGKQPIGRRPPMARSQEATRRAVEILSRGGRSGPGGRGRGIVGRGRGRGRTTGERFGGRRGRGSADEEDGLYLGDNADGEKLEKRLGEEKMKILAEAFEEMSSRVLPSPMEDAYLDALHTNNLIEYEPEYMVEFDNPDIDEKPPMPLEEVLAKARPFLMAYEGMKSHEEWEDAVKDLMERLPYMKELIEMYAGPKRVTAKEQHQELERVAKTIPENVPASVKRFTDRAVMSLKNNPGWGFDKKCQFMDKLVWEVSQHYK